MPAKKPSAKKQTVGKGGVASKGKKHPKKKKSGKGDTVEEAPLIIKGGPQTRGQRDEDEGGFYWRQETDFPLNFFYQPSVDRPNIYTLSSGGVSSGFVVLNWQGEIIFKFPNDTDDGEYQIVFLP